MDIKDILLSNDVIKSINDNMDYLLDIIPEISYMIGFDQNNPHHHLDVWNHTLLALSLSKNDFDIRLCLLLHDIGKPFSYQDEKVRHFKNHQNVSSIMSNIILERLDYDIDYRNYICNLILLHDSRINDKLISEDYYFANTLYNIQYPDQLAHNPSMLEKRKEYLSVVNNKLILKKGSNNELS